MRWVAIAALLVACEAAQAPCDEGATRCAGLVLEGCGADGWATIERCASRCDDALGCLECMPGTRRCEGDVARACRPDGSGTDDERCDAELGLRCDDATGLCLGPCSRASLGRSYVGCEYYPVVLGNTVPEEFSFAIAVASASSEVADVLVEGGALDAAVRLEVPIGGVVVQRLPWVPALKLCSGPRFREECDPPLVSDVLAPRGAYRVRSSRPVVVYQFNPLEYRNEGEAEPHFSYSADASLLLPVNAWGRRYLAVSQRAFRRWPGELAIVASADTEVRVTPTASTLDAPAGETTRFALAAGDALELLAPFEDLTGTLVEADAPIAVISGHFGTHVPLAHAAADHLEESMLPIESLGTRYVVVPTPPAVERLVEQGLAVVQIVAADAEVELTIDPPIEGARTRLAGIGDAITLPSIDRAHEIRATGRVLVAQSIVGGATYGPTDSEIERAGDPAMSIAVPVEQYRREYLVHAPVSYEVSFAAIVAPSGIEIVLDGAVVTEPGEPVGTSGLVALRVPLSNEGDGNHRLSASEPFGVLVYGFGSWTSYLYPGGLDLDVLGPE